MLAALWGQTGTPRAVFAGALTLAAAGALGLALATPRSHPQPAREARAAS